MLSDMNNSHISRSQSIPQLSLLLASIALSLLSDETGLAHTLV